MSASKRRPNGRDDDAPHSLEAEENVLGALLLGAPFAAVVGLLQAADFFVPAHGLIYQAIARLGHAGTAIDHVTVAEELRRLDHLKVVGDEAALSKLARETASTENLVSYARVVADHASRRRLLAFITDRGGDLPEFLEAELARLRALSVSGGLTLRSALAIASEPAHAEWLLKPYIERRAMILMSGAEGTFKSFLALHWALTIAAAGEPVIYLSAEGRGLWKRLRAWCMHHYPRQAWAETLKGLPFLALERPVNLASSAALPALIEAIDHAVKILGRRPALIIVDTMSRNSDGSIESSTEDATAYLNGLDQELRTRYGCSILLIHHVGHQVRDRARGPIVFSSNTDANFMIERPDIEKRVIVVKAGRMKDCDPPPPFELEAQIVYLDVDDENGKAATSLILKGTGRDVPLSMPKPTGKCQQRLLAELERRAILPDSLGLWTEAELREIGRSLGMHKNSARDAVFGLRQLSYLVASGGGCRLAHIPAGRGTKRPNGTESTISSQGIGGPKRPRDL